MFVVVFVVMDDSMFGCAAVPHGNWTCVDKPLARAPIYIRCEHDGLAHFCAQGTKSLGFKPIVKLFVQHMTGSANHESHSFRLLS